MDIRVGTPSPIGTHHDTPTVGSGVVEARVLAVRSPRRRGEAAPHAVIERRATAAQRDPLTGRVLVLLIPDGSRLPEGIESGAFRVFLRFAKK